MSEFDAKERARSIIVAELHFKREASATQLCELGQALRRCLESCPWMSYVTGLDALLRGEAPEHYSKAMIVGDQKIPCYDPILIWALVDYPGKERIDPVGIVEQAIPAGLAKVSFPDPDGGV